MIILNKWTQIFTRRPTLFLSNLHTSNTIAQTSMTLEISPQIFTMFWFYFSAIINAQTQTMMMLFPTLLLIKIWTLKLTKSLKTWKNKIPVSKIKGLFWLWEEVTISIHNKLCRKFKNNFADKILMDSNFFRR